MAEPDTDAGSTGSTAPPSPRRSEPLFCPFDLSSFVETRHRARGYASAAGLADMELYNVVVAVSELMSNALQHGGGAGTLRMWHDEEHLHCEVVDEGPGIPGGKVNGIQRPDPGVIRGRGIWLTRQICERVDVQTGSSGTTVRISCRLHGDR